MQNQNWVRIEMLFHNAMEQPDAQREAYLKDATETEDEYTEVLRLIQAAEVSTDFMSTSIDLGPSTPTLSAGDALGAWCIGEMIGSGGMGEVYQVSRHSETFEQTGALKLARTKDAQYLTRFEQERRLLASLEHPNIGRLIDGGQTAEGDPFMVMEFISGQPITLFAESQNLSQDKRLSLFTDLCRAVSHAHSRLVLHRDIKPANILVSDSGDAKLIDFGVADTLQSDGHVTSYSPLTKAYAAPEQLAGESVSVATDIYALGCVLHEFLAGKRLHNSEDIDPALPLDLRAIINQAVQTAPSDRYESVALMSDDILRFVNSEPVQARNGGRGYRLGKLITRNKYTSVALGLFLAALSVGLVGTYTQMKRSQLATIAAQSAALEQEFEARTSSGFRYGLQTLYGGNEEDGDKIDPAILDASMLKLTQEARMSFDGTDLDQGFLLYSMATHFMDRYDFSTAIDLFEPLLAIDPKTSDILESLYIESKSDLARCYLETEQKDKALNLYGELKTDRQTYGYEYELGHVQDLSGFASLTNEIMDIEETVRVIQETLKRYENENHTSVDISWLYNQWGVILLQQGKLVEAIEPFERNFNDKDGYQIFNPEKLVSATNLAQFQIYFGRDGKKALNYLPRYLPFAIQEFGDEKRHGLIQTLITNAAIVEEQWELADSASLDGLSKLEQDKEYRDGLYFSLVALRGQSLAQLNRFDEAEALIIKGISEIKASSVSQAFPWLACTLNVTHHYIRAIDNPDTQALSAFDETSANCQLNVANRAASQLKYKNLIQGMRAGIQASLK